MKSPQKFTVVIIDDKEASARRIAQKLQGMRISVDRKDFIVDAKTIHIRLKRENSNTSVQLDSWTFADEVAYGLSRQGEFSDLLSAATSKPDMLIVAYIYVADEVGNYFREKGTRATVEKGDTEGCVLTPRDLRRWLEMTNCVSGLRRSKIRNGLFDFAGPLHLHTYTPQGLAVATGSPEERQGNVQVAFPRSEIT
jgi:hypothetical protein